MKIYSKVIVFAFALLPIITNGQIGPVEVIQTVKAVKDVAEQIQEFTSDDSINVEQGSWDDTYRTSEEDGERGTQYSFDVNHPPEGAARIGCICMDGTSMDLKGGGACAGYGGVRHWIYETKDGKEKMYPTERHLQHPQALSEDEMANLSAHNKKQSYGNYNRGIGRLGWEELMAIIIICVTIIFITKTIWSSNRHRE